MQDRGQCNMHASLYYEYGMMLCINRAYYSPAKVVFHVLSKYVLHDLIAYRINITIILTITMATKLIYMQAYECTHGSS